MVSLTGFQPAVDEAVEQEGPEHAVDAAEVADLVSWSSARGEAAEHADEEGEDHGDLDAHFWTDPTRVAAVAAAVKGAARRGGPRPRRRLRAQPRGPRGRPRAARRGHRGRPGELCPGTSWWEPRRVRLLRRPLRAGHARHQRPLPDAEPSPRTCASCADLIEEEGVTTVFSESIASPEMAETLAAEVDLETAVLDPIEGLTDETADEDYVSLMRDNLAAIQKANDCT